MALRAVVGTKADRLEDRAVATPEALVSWCVSVCSGLRCIQGELDYYLHKIMSLGTVVPVGVVCFNSTELL